jgi:hypothetical protein
MRASGTPFAAQRGRIDVQIGLPDLFLQQSETRMGACFQAIDEFAYAAAGNRLPRFLQRVFHSCAAASGSLNNRKIDSLPTFREIGQFEGRITSELAARRLEAGPADFTFPVRARGKNGIQPAIRKPVRETGFRLQSG